MNSSSTGSAAPRFWSRFTPALRADAQAKALKTALQMLGDLTGFGISYFDFDGAGYVKTATEVSSDNSALMRNIRRHEHALEGAIAGICRAVMAASRSLGAELPEEGEVRVAFDDSIITDTTAAAAGGGWPLAILLAPISEQVFARVLWPSRRA